MLPQKPGIIVTATARASSKAAASTARVPLDPFGSWQHSSTRRIALGVHIYNPMLHPYSLMQQSSPNILQNAPALVLTAHWLRQHKVLGYPPLVAAYLNNNTYDNNSARTPKQHSWVAPAQSATLLGWRVLHKPFYLYPNSSIVSERCYSVLAWRLLILATTPYSHAESLGTHSASHHHQRFQVVLASRVIRALLHTRSVVQHLPGRATTPMRSISTIELSSRAGCS